MKIREHHPLEPVTEAHFVVEASMSELEALFTASATLDSVIAKNIRATESAEMIESMNKCRFMHLEMRDAIIEAIQNATGPRSYKED